MACGESNGHVTDDEKSRSWPQYA